MGGAEAASTGPFVVEYLVRRTWSNSLLGTPSEEWQRGRAHEFGALAYESQHVPGLALFCFCGRRGGVCIAVGGGKASGIQWRRCWDEGSRGAKRRGGWNGLEARRQQQPAQETIHVHYCGLWLVCLNRSIQSFCIYNTTVHGGIIVVFSSL